jgi:hypothetical protein
MSWAHELVGCVEVESKWSICLVRTVLVQPLGNNAIPAISPASLHDSGPRVDNIMQRSLSLSIGVASIVEPTDKSW